MDDLRDRLQAALSGRYAVQRELGRGGMATVYLAHDVKHDRPVALKVLDPNLAATLGAERFLREIRLAARLQHPYILPVHDSGEADSPSDTGRVLWFSMPFVEGESLRERLRRDLQLPIDEVIGIAREVAEALDYAHSQDIVHRDVKPENILLSRGHALVADFGIARALAGGAARPAGEQLTQTGVALGTPAYMSPEQATGEREVDGRSDIYSLGCVLYEMLVGEPPFTGPTAQAIISKRFTDPVPSVRTWRQIAPALEQTVSRCLATVPADRFPTAGALAERLRSRDLTAAAEHLATMPARPIVEQSIAVLPFARITDRSVTSLGFLGHGYAVAGRERDAQSVLEELTQLRLQRYVSAYDFAVIHLGLGDRSAALQWLERAFQERAHQMAWIKVDPRLDPLRGTATFDRLLQRMKLADLTPVA